MVAPIPVEAPGVMFSDGLPFDGNVLTADHHYRIPEHGETRTRRFKSAIFPDASDLVDACYS